MSTTSKVTSEKMLSFEGLNTTPSKKLSITTNPIELKHISNTLTNGLTMNSVLKAGLIFFTMIGGYYLAKTTGIFSNFGWKEKISKDVDNGEANKRKSTLIERRNLKKMEQVNNPSVNRMKQTYKNKDEIVIFKEREVKKFKNLQKAKEKNIERRKSSDQKSISIKNPIPNQNIAVRKLFNLTIDGSHVFNSNDALFLETVHLPKWLTSSNPAPILKSSYDTPEASGVAVSENYAYVVAWNSSLQVIDINDPTNPTFISSYDKIHCVNELAISENYAYVLNWKRNLEILDISNPSKITFKSSYEVIDI
jgi:hypothetical protein